MKPISNKEIVSFVELTRTAQYDYHNKVKFRNLGRKILKWIAYSLQLPPAQFQIRFNPGGMACSGDHVLHHDNFYLNLSDNTNSGWFYYRTCKGQKDYTGGPNQIVYWKKLIETGLVPLIENLRKINNVN